MHEKFMHRSFELARQGLGKVSPNPMVGAVLVKDGRIIGEGFHSHHGAPHAEADCFNKTTEDPKGATLYVNLEPCCHTKKLTPPCVPLVIEKKISKIVISNLDPNPFVAGGGVKLIQEAGIEVITGVMKEEGERLNEVFFHRMLNGKPFIHLKTASTLDGKIALLDGTSKWITGQKSREDSHWGRLSCDAIMIGAETLRRDNPSLTVRIPNLNVTRAPWRIVLTKSGDLPKDSILFTDENKARTLVVVIGKAEIKVVPIEQVIRLSAFSFDELYQNLFEKGIYSIWLEGGPGLHSLFLENRQVQRFTQYIAPKIMGEGIPLFNLISDDIFKLIKLRDIEIKEIEGDIRVTGRL